MKDLFDFNEDNRIIRWLESTCGHEKFRGGERRLARALQEPISMLKKKNTSIIVIGGTNGKGETAYFLSYLLGKQGINHTLWVSPHILSIRERISYNFEKISYRDLWDLLKYEHNRVKSLGETLSYYELLLSAFIQFTLSRSVEVCILEVGLGGRLDGVNLIGPSLTAITSISRDHQSILGNSYKSILMEKLGITRKNIPLITTLELLYTRKIVKNYTDSHAIPWIDLFALRVISKNDVFSNRNKILAKSLFDTLQERKIDANLRFENLKEHLNKVSFPSFKGRKERMTLDRISFIFIGSHNLDGFRKLKQMVVREGLFDKVLISFSKRSDEELRSLKLFLYKEGNKIAKKIFLTHCEHYKSFSYQTIKGLENNYVGFVDDFKKWISINSKISQRILITGSYYFIGVVQAYIYSIGHKYKFK